jgi:hypothetical protein
MPTELQLLPPEGHPQLTPDDLLQRLRDEFGYVEVSSEEGRQNLLGIIERVERTSPDAYARVRQGGGEALKRAHLESLHNALPSARSVRFGDDAEHCVYYLSGVGKGVLIVVEEDWENVIAQRCARALGYAIHVV